MAEEEKGAEDTKKEILAHVKRINAKRKGFLSDARTSVKCAAMASCTCLTKTNDATHHAEDCLYRKLSFIDGCITNVMRDLESAGAPVSGE